MGFQSVPCERSLLANQVLISVMLAGPVIGEQLVRPMLGGAASQVPLIRPQSPLLYSALEQFSDHGQPCTVRRCVHEL